MKCFSTVSPWPTYPHLLLCKRRVECRGILHGPVQSNLLKGRWENEVGIFDQYVADFSRRRLTFAFFLLPF